MAQLVRALFARTHFKVWITYALLPRFIHRGKGDYYYITPSNSLEFLQP